jgi:hypothetical protein
MSPKYEGRKSFQISKIFGFFFGEGVEISIFFGFFFGEGVIPARVENNFPLQH